MFLKALMFKELGKCLTWKLPTRFDKGYTDCGFSSLWPGQHTKDVTKKARNKTPQTRTTTYQPLRDNEQTPNAENRNVISEGSPQRQTAPTGGEERECKLFISTQTEKVV